MVRRHSYPYVISRCHCRRKKLLPCLGVIFEQPRPVNGRRVVHFLLRDRVDGIASMVNGEKIDRIVGTHIW